MSARRRLALLVPLAAVTGALVIGPSSASAASPSVLNTGTGCSGQLQWLVTCATSGVTNNSGNIMRISTWAGHDATNNIASLITDDDWDSTANPSNVRTVSCDKPTIAGGYPRSRCDLSYTFPTSNTGFSCNSIFGGTRRTTDRFARFQARDNASQTSATSSSQVKFVAGEQCLGAEDFAYLYSWGASNFDNQISPGQSVTYTYTGDDPDTTGSSDFQGVNWRLRNLRTGATTTPAVSCPGNGDNAVKSLTANFPNRGAWVVEAELMDGSGCTDNQNSGYWFAIGTADVNSAAAPSLSLDSATTTQSGVVRPTYGQNFTARAQGLVDPDSANGGGAQILEWDLDNNTGNGVSGFETTNVAGYGSTLTAPVSQTVASGSQTTPGLYSVRAKVTDNGAGDAADSDRRTSSPVTLQYRVDAAPTANAQTVQAESDAASLPITLTGADTDGDSLSYSIVSPPAHGQLCTNSSGACTTSGTGAARFYRPDHDFAGADSFTFQVNDGFGRTANATVTVNVTPDTTITASPPTDSSSSSATFEFGSPVTSANPALTYECRVDSSLETDFSACSSPKTYTGLSDGQHKFDVRARTGSFIDPTPASFTWTLDATPPDTAIDSQPPPVSGTTSASFTYHSDDSNANFECKLDSGSFDPCSSSGKSYTNLSEGQHMFQVRAVDHFGRPDATPATYSWSVDLSFPSVHFDSTPANPTNQTTAVFQFSSTDPNATFTCSLDSAPFTSCSSPQTYPGLAEGPHNFAVKATNLANNTSQPLPYGWTIDTTVPETSLDSGPPSQSTSAVATFQFSSPDSSAFFECRLDSNLESDWEGCSSPQLYADLGDGHHTFQVRAADAAGNRDATPAAQTWQIDTTPPQTTIDSGPTATTGATDADFAFSSDDNAATFQCKLDGGSWDGCASPDQRTGLTEGVHVFRVRAVDSFGNTDPTPASRTWTVDTTGPTASIDSGPSGVTASASTSFEFSSSEAGSGFECSLDNASFTPCTSPKSYASLAQGAHSFAVRATDPTGNPGGTATRNWTVDTTAPDVQIDTAPPATTSSSQATFTFSSSDGTAGFQCRLDGGSWQGCSSPRTYGGLDDGQHSFDVRSRDAVGNTSSPASASWTIADSGAPNTAITSAPGEPTVSTTATFAFTATEPSTFECKLDAGNFDGCSSPTTYTGLSSGTHTFSVRAIDLDNNPDPTPATHTWTISTPSAGSGGGGSSTTGGGVAGETAKTPLIAPATRALKHGRGAVATVTCGSDQCRLTGSASLRIGKRRYRVGINPRSAIAAGQSATVTVSLPRAARKALRRRGRGRLSVHLTAGSATGPVTQIVNLKVTK